MDKPIKCNGHVWYPFLDSNLEIKNFSPFGYYRICAVCGKIEYRNKIKEYDKSIVDRYRDNWIR